jgi:hypothetical protein
MDEVRLREVPERVVLVERRPLVVADLPAFVEEALARQHGLLAAAGVGPAAPPYLAFLKPVTDEVAGTVELCTPVPDAIARRTDVGLPLRIEPLHREAFTSITRREAAYPAILHAYALVEGWAREAGLTPAGPPREIYFADPSTVGEDDPVVDVAQPVQ